MAVPCTLIVAFIIFYHFLTFDIDFRPSELTLSFPVIFFDPTALTHIDVLASRTLIIKCDTIYFW
jgi:hypothetical protein